MRHLPGLLLAAALGLQVLLGSSVAQALSLGEKAELQAAMQRHVDRQLVDHAYLVLNQSGEVLRLHPVTAHPLVMVMGEDKFVLCFEFRNDSGRDVEVDFYISRTVDSFVVFHAAVQNRKLLKRLMRAGKVSRAD